MKSLIDYYGESIDSGSELTFQQLKQYWINGKKEESGINYQWSMKDQTLLSRLMKEYSSNDLVTMLDYYLKCDPTSTFGTFFKRREYIYKKAITPDDYGYD